MQTQLGTYCQQFDETLRPLLTNLQGALDAVDAAPRTLPARALLTPLQDASQQLHALADKVREQQAYVLIFGPLKSGKSTLMNAIAAAYVSEVSSLPAYPCLVFVRAGKQREYVVGCYDGSERRYADSKQLHADIDRAHADLAKAIRQAEQRGEAFDPQEHFPSAIRRVDVHVPDSDLEATGAVLVDTPGLYTRMRFGYDRMTREFRNAAACAVFVVKSDTLFLEQVFAEFQQLLDLFSRIFLVVNVDSQKRDVSPDGKLVPSLEQSRPQAVLQAFEQLAMSAPLQQAAREGRVRMYPVDLLHAASQALQKLPADKGAAGFDAFQRDLRTYLASSEYLSAFLRDSLQRAESLALEVQGRLAGDTARTVHHQHAEVEEQLTWLAAERRRVEQALQLDWTEAFAKSRRDVEAEVERAARDHGAKLLRTLGASIDTWFLSSHSLEWLVAGQWTPLVRDYRDEVANAGKRAFDQCTAQIDGGLDLPDGIAELSRRAGIDLRRLREHALAELGAIAWPKNAMVPVDVRQIPIKKGVVDRLAFRSQDKVRMRLFGPAEKPDTKIPGKDKARHLGDPGRLHLHQCVAQFRAELLPQTVAVLSRHLGDLFFAAASTALRSGLTDYLPRIDAKVAELEAERATLGAVVRPLQRLEEASSGLLPKLRALGSQFAREVTLQPAPREVVLDPKSPPPRRDQVPPPADRSRKADRSRSGRDA